MKISRQEAVALLVGLALGAAPFLAVHFMVSRSPQGIDATEMWGFPAIALAPFGALFGAIVVLSIVSRK